MCHQKRRCRDKTGFGPYDESLTQFCGTCVKTKAYKLAAELGLQEQPVLDWLRANGYPNARRADMIRADVAQAARKALGRQGRGRIQSARPLYQTDRIDATIPSRMSLPGPRRWSVPEQPGYRDQLRPQ